MYLKKDLLGLKDLTKEEILCFIETAREMKPCVENPDLRNDYFKNYNLITLFYENSTRTKLSFFSAAEYLGCKINDLALSTSSVNKGESLLDTGRNIDAMGVDMMIMRHSETGAPHVLSENVNACVINAGDGSNEHPTQGLLDLMTILEHKDSLEGVKVAIVGDISNSRVARSNCFALSKLGAEVVLTGPSTMLPSKISGGRITTDIDEALKNADVIIMLRIQMERQKMSSFPNLREYTRMFGLTKERLALAKSDAIILHPGPINRGIELTSDLIEGSQSVIYPQVTNGVAVRMAIIKILLENRKKLELM